MKKVIFIVVSFLVFSLSALFAQQDTESSNGKINFKKEAVILKNTDPNFPKLKETGNKDNDYQQQKKLVEDYSLKHPPFPMYKNTGNSGADQAKFEREKEAWFKLNPFLPEYIDRGDPVADKENYEKAKREWENRFPEKYKKIMNDKFYPNESKKEIFSTVSSKTKSNKAGTDDKKRMASTSNNKVKSENSENKSESEYKNSISENNDTQNIKTQKKDWLKQHPELQIKIQNPEALKQLEKGNSSEK